MKKILYVILHGSMNSSRYFNVKETWGKNVDCLFYSDHEDIEKNIKVPGVRSALQYLNLHKEKTIWAKYIPCKILSPKPLQLNILEIVKLVEAHFHCIHAPTGSGKTVTLNMIDEYLHIENQKMSNDKEGKERKEKYKNKMSDIVVKGTGILEKSDDETFNEYDHRLIDKLNTITERLEKYGTVLQSSWKNHQEKCSECSLTREGCGWKKTDKIFCDAAIKIQLMHADRSNIEDQRHKIKPIVQDEKNKSHHKNNKGPTSSSARPRPSRSSSWRPPTTPPSCPAAPA